MENMNDIPKSNKSNNSNDMDNFELRKEELINMFIGGYMDALKRGESQDETRNTLDIENEMFNELGLDLSYEYEIKNEFNQPRYKYQLNNLSSSNYIKSIELKRQERQERVNKLVLKMKDSRSSFSCKIPKYDNQNKILSYSQYSQYSQDNNNGNYKRNHKSNSTTSNNSVNKDSESDDEKEDIDITTNSTLSKTPTPTLTSTPSTSTNSSVNSNDDIKDNNKSLILPRMTRDEYFNKINSIRVIKTVRFRAAQRTLRFDRLIKQQILRNGPNCNEVEAIEYLINKVNNMYPMEIDSDSPEIITIDATPEAPESLPQEHILIETESQTEVIVTDLESNSKVSIKSTQFNINNDNNTSINPTQNQTNTADTTNTTINDNQTINNDENSADTTKTDTNSCNTSTETITSQNDPKTVENQTSTNNESKELESNPSTPSNAVKNVTKDANTNETCIRSRSADSSNIDNSYNSQTTGKSSKRKKTGKTGNDGNNGCSNSSDSSNIDKNRHKRNSRNAVNNSNNSSNNSFDNNGVKGGKNNNRLIRGHTDVLYGYDKYGRPIGRYEIGYNNNLGYGSNISRQQQKEIDEAVANSIVVEEKILQSKLDGNSFFTQHDEHGNNLSYGQAHGKHGEHDEHGAPVAPSIYNSVGNFVMDDYELQLQLKMNQNQQIGGVSPVNSMSGMSSVGIGKKRGSGTNMVLPASKRRKLNSRQQRNGRNIRHQTKSKSSNQPIHRRNR